MKTSISLALILGFLAISLESYAAWDCNGPWKVMHNRKTSPCQALGLNSRTGSCRPGDKYEMFCDDDKGGKYRVCQGTRRCTSNRKQERDCTYWDYNVNRPCPSGYRNYDCYGGCDARQRENRHRRDQYHPCLDWDYYYDRPCPWGYKNYDCRGGCELR